MKTLVKLVAVTGLMLAAVVACGKKADSGAAGEASTTSATVAAKASCTMVSELGTCNEYRGGRSFGLEKSLCEGFKGTFSNAGCSTDGEIGACTMSDGEVKRYYGSKVAGDRALTLVEAQTDCESDSVKGQFLVDPHAASAMAPVAKTTIPAAKLAPTVKATASIRAKD